MNKNYIWADSLGGDNWFHGEVEKIKYTRVIKEEGEVEVLRVRTKEGHTIDMTPELVQAIMEHEPIPNHPVKDWNMICSKCEVNMKCAESVAQGELGKATTFKCPIK